MAEINLTQSDIEGFWARTRPDEKTGCLLWTGGHTKKNGYGKVYINKRYQKAHRVAWVITNGAIPAGLCVRHSCDRPGCVSPTHLLIGTHHENMMDMVERHRHRPARGVAHGSRTCPGRLPCGDAHWSRRMPSKVRRGTAINTVKLTAEQVQEIRQMSAAGLSAREIARRKGVSPTPVHMILAGKSWKHVTLATHGVGR